MEFTHEEKLTIQESISLRKKISDDSAKHINELNAILAEINFPISNLKTRQKALINGCIKELLIYPNENLIGLSDYDILLLNDKFKDEFKRIDVGFQILNKFKKRTERKHRLFKSTQEKIEKLSKVNSVYYSVSSGNIYKVGIKMNSNKGLYISLSGNSTLSNFEIVELYKNQFTQIGKPAEVIETLKHYSKSYTLTESQQQVITLLEKADSF
ncbi:hypothetical protein [Flavobacterium sp. GT3P67]|uniref:hypothetical protein n=1 Tax=Flavobacterium sp. GT3P67 TaxID=2541722 RepID=UPI0010522871|nr:hypothetical protein [Flavobacterium sp. GT3P67]TDE52719.1 hypothetical protein E0H99_11390 [Flavobacterium sp. GT3P67]